MWCSTVSSIPCWLRMIPEKLLGNPAKHTAQTQSIQPLNWISIPTWIEILFPEPYFRIYFRLSKAVNEWLWQKIFGHNVIVGNNIFETLVGQDCAKCRVNGSVDIYFLQGDTCKDCREVRFKTFCKQNPLGMVFRPSDPFSLVSRASLTSRTRFITPESLVLVHSDQP